MTLRDTIEAAVNTAEGSTQTTEPEVQPTAVEPAQTQPLEEKAGRTAGRQRDELGRLLPGKAQKHEEPAPIQQTPAAAKPKMPPPSSWKKDHWEFWDKIAAEHPAGAEYLTQRESEFAKGVSTYKQEYEAVKPLAEAMQPFMQTLQQHGINPAQWIQSMGNAHHRLVFGSPQDKLQMFAKLAQDYGVPLQALYDQQAQQQFLMQQAIQPQGQPQTDVRALVRTEMMEAQAQTELEQFKAAKAADGQSLYPHFEAVKNDMALLLEHGQVSDLKSAYDKAIRLHDDIWAKEQEAQQAAAQKASQEAQAKIALKAKSAAISPKTATPAGQVATATKGIRQAVEAAVEAHAQGGRV